MILRIFEKLNLFRKQDRWIAHDEERIVKKKTNQEEYPEIE